MMMTLRYSWRTLVMAALVFSAGAAQAADAGPQKSTEDQAADALRWGDFDELERMHTLYRQPGQRTPQGWSKLSEFRRGLAQVLDGRRGAPDAYFAETEALTLQWAQERPGSALAHLLHAKALVGHGWSYRGTGFANTVAPGAMAEFRNYIQRAAQYLTANAGVAFADGTAHSEMIKIGMASEWGRDKLWNIATDGLAKNPEDDSIYFTMLDSLLPKWGGSAVAVDRFIDDAVKRTKTERGMELYARLYASAAYDDFRHELFTASGAQWPKMKQGFEDFLSRYPDPDNINRFAYFACIARDKATTLELLPQVGEKPILARWGANAARTFQSCQRWAREL